MFYLNHPMEGYRRLSYMMLDSDKEMDVEIILQRAREKFPQETPRIILDNGPRFISREFKEFIRIIGMDHVRTSPYYPQSNGEIERWHQSLKRECIRSTSPLSLEEARKNVGNFNIIIQNVFIAP